MIKAIIFDYNGVLADDVKWHVKAYRQVLEEVGIKLSNEEIVSRLGKPTPEVIRIALDDFGVKADYMKLTAKKAELANKWSKEAGVFFPNTVETVKKLKESYRLAMLTASIKSQMKEPPEEFFGLFEEIINGDIILEKKFKPKPDPGSLLRIAEKMRIKPQECCYIGDLPVDMKAAKNAGIKAIGLITETCNEKTLKEAGADITINKLNELLEKKL